MQQYHHEINKRWKEKKGVKMKCAGIEKGERVGCEREQSKRVQGNHQGGLQSRCVLAKGHVLQRLQLDSLAMQPSERTRHACHFYVQRNGIFRKTVYGMTDGTQTQLGFEQCSKNQSTKRMGGSNANEDSFGSFVLSSGALAD